MYILKIGLIFFILASLICCGKNSEYIQFKNDTVWQDTILVKSSYPLYRNKIVVKLNVIPDSIKDRLLVPNLELQFNNRLNIGLPSSTIIPKEINIIHNYIEYFTTNPAFLSTKKCIELIQYDKWKFATFCWYPIPIITDDPDRFRLRAICVNTKDSTKITVLCSLTDTLNMNRKFDFLHDILSDYEFLNYLDQNKK